MKASELIEELKKQIEEHGDKSVTIRVCKPYQQDVWADYQGKARVVFYEKERGIVVYDEGWNKESK